MFGISRQNAGYYDAVIAELDPELLELVEETYATHICFDVATDNMGAVAANATHVAVVDWQFTWFRHITPLTPKYQRLIVQKILKNAKTASGWTQQRIADAYRMSQGNVSKHLAIAAIPDIAKHIIRGEYSQLSRYANNDVSVLANGKYSHENNWFTFRHFEEITKLRRKRIIQY